MHCVAAVRLLMVVYGCFQPVFPRERIVILIDGCFWHRSPDHYREPATNQSAWDAKIRGNVARGSCR